MSQICTSCQAPFEVTDDDRQFYEDISPVLNGKKYPIPSPTLCPSCRYQRRIVWRNDRHFHRRQCNKTGETMLSMFPSTAPFPVYSTDAWWSDDWEGLDYGQDIDFDRPFFEQLAELRTKVPLPALSVVKPSIENSDYCNHAGFIKDCYLVFDTRFSERCLYGKTYERSYDCVDCYKAFDCEQCYEIVGGYGCHTCTYCQDCSNCNECHYSYNLIGCKNCYGCVNLRNKENYVFNEPCSSPEEWKKRVTALQQKHSHDELIEKLNEIWRSRPRRWMYELKTENCTGDYLIESKDCHNCFDCEYLEGCKYCQDVKKNDQPNFHVYDTSHFGGNLSECLECCCIGNVAQRLVCCLYCYGDVSDLFYCLFCVNGAKNLFGCIGLKHKEYCILNKQYTKEEYEQLTARLIEHMQTTGEWGENLPIQDSFISYNESIAMEFFPLKKEAVEQRGWQWKGQTDDVSNITKTIPASQLPASITDVPDDILHWAVECEVTKRPFKIVKQELEFYRKMNLSIPKVHPDERHRRRLALRNPRVLYERKCEKCSKDIETTYAPDGPETIYCEECYLTEVY